MTRHRLFAILVGLAVSAATVGVANAQPADEEQPQAAPPAPPANVPAPPKAQAPQQQSANGQWVYTDQYGWIWMPYGDNYVSEDAGSPYAYVYEPAVGWSWVGAPWVWGWGPLPYYGAFGAGRFHWYRGAHFVHPWGGGRVAWGGGRFVGVHGGWRGGGGFRGGSGFHGGGGSHGGGGHHR